MAAEEAFAEIEAQRERFNEEVAEKLAAYEAMRREQREKEDEEIRQLKDKQARRREEREAEEQERREREREEEARRKEEEEERKKKMAEEKARRDAKLKKGAKDAFALAQGAIQIQKKAQDDQPKRKEGPTEEQLAAKKKEFLDNVCRPTDLSSMGTEDVKQHIRRLHEKICKVVGETYDLEKRTESQEYDYKELIGRQKQQARAKAIRMGLDPEEAERSKHPPKLKIVTKYDRQIDRRGYGERRKVYEKQNAIPHFPNVPPPESKLEKKILEYEDVPAQEEEAAAEEEEAVEEEEAEEEEEEE